MNRMSRGIAAALLVLGAASFAARGDETAPIEIASAADLAAPPVAATLSDGRTLVALATADGVDVATLRAGARTFDAPARVARRGDLTLGGRRGPRLAATEKVVVAAAVTRWKKEGGGGDLLAWRSTDGGATWSDAVRVNDVPGSAAEALFDLAALGDGRFVVVWLDCRVKGQRLRADFSADGATWGEDVLAYESPEGSICQCCHPAVAPTKDGGAVAAFRNWIGPDRDVWTLRLARGATKFAAATKSGKGAWKIAACPMAGPSLAAKGDDFVCAWRRETHVYLATGATERDLGEGTEPRVLALADGVHVFWTTRDALVHLAPGAARAEEIAKGGTFPFACAAADGAAGVVTWLDAGTKRARVAVIR